MVGVQLQKPASNHAGYEDMTSVKKTLVTHFGDNCQIVKDDVSSIKLKLRWRGPQGRLFTMTLTPNTGYIQIQGPADKILALAKHIQQLVGGDVHSARQVGAAPHNPSEQESGDGATNDGADRAADHGATDHAAHQQGTSQEAADHGATSHSATMEATVGTEEAAVGTGTSSTSGVGVCPITGNGNVQVGSVVINTTVEDGQGSTAPQNAMNTLINGLRNLLLSTTPSED